MAVARKALSFIVCCLIAVSASMAAQTPSTPLTDWNNLGRLVPGRDVTVHLSSPKSKVKGAFVSYSEDAVAVRLKNGVSQTLGKVTVRKISASRGRARTSVLIGAAAGAIVMTTLSVREGDFNAFGYVVFAGGGAGIGALFGYLGHAIGGSELIYESPKP